MTRAWKEPPGREDCADGQDIGPDESQLEMFDVGARAGAEMLLPPERDSAYGGAHREGGGPGPVEMVVGKMSTHDFLDVGGADSDELRRLEDSIRWLMNESGVRHIPRATTLPPVRGLSPVELHDDDALLLNPDTLFPPRSSRRRASIARGAAKILLVTAIAAPTAYFIANWTQFPGTAAPSDEVVVSDAAAVSDLATTPGPFEERIAVTAPAPRRPPPEAAQIGNEIPSAAQPEPTVGRGLIPAETSPDGPADANAAELKRAPEQPPGASATPSDPALAPVGANASQSSNPPPAAATPAKKPAMSASEIALMIDRGRVLFDAGDLAAARLFFRRAANAGDAAAALAMGATYDPDVLSKRFIRGIEADATEARMWYERARELGSPEGPRRIEMLAHR
jgi:hypothetical protein